LAILPCPQNKQGFIDEEELFKLVVGTLKLCSLTEFESYMEDVQPFQVGLLLSNHNEKQKEHYEMMAYAFQIGYYKAKTGKKIDMFQKESKAKTERITTEQKQEDFKALDEIFNY
jgi:hypothetical protein